MNAILGWLTHTVTVMGLSAPAWAFVAIAAGLVGENLLGRSKASWARSLLGVVAMGLRWALQITRIGSIPVVGAALVRFFEVVANVDLDGDGHVGDPPAPSRIGPVIALLAAFLVAIGCGTTKPVTVITDIGSCAATDLIGDVNNGLVAPDWTVELEKIAVKCGIKVLNDVVAHVGSDASHAAQAEGSDFERMKADRARQWLAEHPVTP